jgi:hypothetical protein
MEPATTTGAMAYAVSKIPYALAALFTGTVVMFFRKKQTIGSHGKLASAAIIGGACSGGAVIFGGALAVYLGMDPNNVNTGTAIGGAIGLIALGVIVALANFLDKSEGKDILEIAQEIKSGVSKPVEPKVIAPKPTRRVKAGVK